MITKIEALNYRSLRYVSQELAPFLVLIGPNASGKSTLLDVIRFLGEFIQAPTIEDVVRRRVSDFRDLVWMQVGDWFELAVEVAVPAEVSARFRMLRYEIRVGLTASDERIVLLRENVWLSTSSDESSASPGPELTDLPATLIHSLDAVEDRGLIGRWWQVLEYTPETQRADYYVEANEQPYVSLSQGRRTGEKLQRSNLQFIPDEPEFPVLSWFASYFTDAVQIITLDSDLLRQPSLPQSTRERLLPTGANLPWVVQHLKDKAPDQFADWLAHLQTALPDIHDITTFERPEDRQRYLIVEYTSGLKIPSWAVSDGTLRLLALTIIAYLPDNNGIYLIEEPENGVHPRLLEAIYQSLSHVYDAQVLLATHSAMFLNLVDPQQLLTFARLEHGETRIVRGDRHPRLADWDREISLSTLFAAGVLE